MFFLFCFIILNLLIFITPAVVAQYGVVYPPAVLGHSSVDSRKLGNSTSSPPGHQAVDPALTYEWTPRVSLKQQERRTRQGWLDIPPGFMIKDRSGYILYFSYCQQIPWKDQKHWTNKCLCSLSLNLSYSSVSRLSVSRTTSCCCDHSLFH